MGFSRLTLAIGTLGEYLFGERQPKSTRNMIEELTYAVAAQIDYLLMFGDLLLTHITTHSRRGQERQWVSFPIL